MDSSLLGYANESFWGRLSHIGSLSGSRIIISKKKNLVRFAHNWNNGMLEYWDIGFIFHVVEK